MAPNGSDSNPGSQSQPFRTIQKGVNGLQAGDTLLIRGGTYAERVVLNQRVGSPSNWITIRAYPNETVTLDGQNSLAHNFYIGGGAEPKTQYVRIQGLRLLNARTAIAINEHASDIAIDGNRLEGFVDSGIYIGLFSLPNIPTGRIIIQNNTIVRNKLPGASGGTNIGLYNNQGGNIIRNNVIQDTTGNPNDISSPTHLDCIGGGSDFQMGTGLNRDTDVYNNTITDCSDDGIQADGIAMNVRIWGNTLRAKKTNWSGISLVPSIVGPVYVFRNLVIGQLTSGMKQGQNSTGAQYIYHNTFYTTQASADGFFQSDTGLKNVTALNNIIQGGRYAIEYSEPSSGSNIRFDYNNLYSTDPSRFVKLYRSYLNYDGFRELGYETHGLNLDATNEFIDAEEGDFHLKVGSRLVNRGVVIPGFNDPHSRWAYRGSAPDLGAYELTARRASLFAP